MSAPPPHHLDLSTIDFINLLQYFSYITTMASHTHDHDGASHSHAGADHGHTHEILDGPGSYLGREMPIVEGRDWRERAFTVGIGGYVPFSSQHVHITNSEGRGNG